MDVGDTDEALVGAINAGLQANQAPLPPAATRIP
jgi:hypothetical protein